MLVYQRVMGKTSNFLWAMASTASHDFQWLGLAPGGAQAQTVREGAVDFCFFPQSIGIFYLGKSILKYIKN